MRLLVDGAIEVIGAMRLATPGQWMLRVLCAASLLGVVWLCLVWFPMPVQGVLAGVVVFGLVWTIAKPESWGPLLSIAGVSFWWVAGAPGAGWWQAAVVALLLAVFHLTSALAAAAPSYATIRRRAAGMIVVRGLGYLLACAAGIGLVVGVAAIPAGVVPRGTAWVVLTLMALVGVAVMLRRPRLEGADS